MMKASESGGYLFVLISQSSNDYFYARAYPSDWGVFRRFARSAIRGTPSPAQRGSTHRFPRYCTATWRVVQSHYIRKESLSKLRLSQSGGYLLSHNIPQCSTIGDAVSLSALSLPCALAPLRSASLRSLSRARALSRAPQARTAHTPHGAHRTP